MFLPEVKLWFVVLFKLWFDIFFSWDLVWDSLELTALKNNFTEFPLQNIILEIFFLKKKRHTEEVNLFLHWISLMWELFSVLYVYVPCGWGGCWSSSRHKVEVRSPALCLLCASELHFRVCDKARSPHVSTRKMLRGLSGSRSNNRLRWYSTPSSLWEFLLKPGTQI